MSKIIRVIIVVVVLGLIGLVSNQVVQASWAPRASAPGQAQVSEQNGQQSVEPGDTQPLTMGQEGTIQPPGCDGLIIPVTGEYSICGVAVVSAELKGKNVEVMVTLEPLPTDVGNVLAGTVNIQCLVNGKVHQGPHTKHAEPRVCFAAPPDKEVQVNFYDEKTESWIPVETTVADGRACAPADYSGKYVLVEK